MDDSRDILYHRDRINRGIILTAAGEGHSGIIKLLINTKGGQQLLSEAGNLHWQDTPWHTAAFYARPEAVQTLIDSGADTAARQSQGKTPLHLAIQEAHDSYGKRKAVIELLLRSTDPFLVDYDSRNFIHVATDRGRPRSLKILGEKLTRHTLERLLTEKNKRGETPLVAAARSCSGAWKRCFN